MAERDATERPLYHRRFLDLVKCAKDHPGMQYLMAVWHLRAGRCRVAQQGLLDLLSIPECEVPVPLLQTCLALAYHRGHQSDEAVRTIESVVVEGPCAVEVLVVKAIIYQGAQPQVVREAHTAVEIARSELSVWIIARRRLKSSIHSMANIQGSIRSMKHIQLQIVSWHLRPIWKIPQRVVGHHGTQWNQKSQFMKHTYVKL